MNRTLEEFFHLNEEKLTIISTVQSDLLSGGTGARSVRVLGSALGKTHSGRLQNKLITHVKEEKHYVFNQQCLQYLIHSPSPPG